VLNNNILGHRVFPAGRSSGPTDCATLQGLNAWLTRAAFEVLSSSALQQKAKASIQAKLGDMKRPAFLQQVQLLSLDMGNLPPVVSDVRVCAEAGPGGALVPQLRVRLTYQVRCCCTGHDTVIR
jgi:hypothetical protein